MYERILVPLDGSKNAESVLPHVQALAKAEGSEIIIIRVAVDPIKEYTFLEAGLAQDIVMKEVNAARQYVDRIAFDIRTAGIRCYWLVGEGAVAETILETAERLQVDVIAMSSHGLNSASRWLLGSATDQVVQHSTIPVLLIHAKTDGSLRTIL